MLKIRMQRTGRINSPSYRIVVVEHTEGPKTGNIVEKVGTYDPKTKEKKLDAERIKYWLSVGAQASPTVHNMLVSLGMIDAKKINVLPKYKAPVDAAAEAEKAALNERQKKAVEFLKKHKSLKTRKYMELNNTSFGTAIADITELLKFKYVKKVGSYRGAYYVLNEER